MVLLTFIDFYQELSMGVYPLLDLRFVAYDLICFMQVFDLVHTWHVFVPNSRFNGYNAMVFGSLAYELIYSMKVLDWV